MARQFGGVAARVSGVWPACAPEIPPNWTSWRCRRVEPFSLPCCRTSGRMTASCPWRPTGLMQEPVDQNSPPHRRFV